MAFDATQPFDPPELSRDEAVHATSTCLSVPVLHAQDVETSNVPPDEPLPHTQVDVTVRVGGAALEQPEFEAQLLCPSGRLEVGDAEAYRVVDVPAGVLRVQVSRRPRQFAEEVVLHVASER
jgi:hypothetical protein